MSAHHQAGAEPASKTRKRNEQPLHVAQIADALLTLKTVQALTALGRSSIYQKVAQRTFPTPIRQGKRCTRWRAGDVQAWLQAQAQNGGTQ